MRRFGSGSALTSPRSRRAASPGRRNGEPAAASCGSSKPIVPAAASATPRIAAGVSLFELGRIMGTSVDQIDKTYGHLLPDSLDRTRTALDAFITGPAPRRRAEHDDARSGDQLDR